jgi:type IV secretory pathway VirD2 relaxase
MFRDDEKEFRLRPRKPPRPATRNDATAWAIAFKAVMHYARASRKVTPKRASGSRHSIPRNQRCAIRVTYTRNTVRGQWRAHGRYIERESAAGGEGHVGFDHTAEGVDLAARLESWQAARDERLWKIIISPEFGERVDLSRLSRDLMKQIERDVGMPLEWVAVSHFNTEHPHVHIALRGVGPDREPIHLKPDYIKHGIRQIAEDLCTRQLGHRTELDAAEAERREIHQNRFTSLDRIIARTAEPLPEATEHLMARAINSTALGRCQHSLAARLAVLEDMGLAERIGPDTWSVRTDFEAVLRAMQRINDRQRVLAAHGVVVSDERLPIEVLDFHKATLVEGRILVHGEDEQSGRGYLMLEGTDARVHFIHYTTEIEQARARGKLRVNSFARFRRMIVGQESTLQIEDLGDAESLLNKRGQFDATARNLIKRGIIPTEDGWGGWLGRYQAAVRRAAMELEYPHPANDRDRIRDLQRGR